MRKLLYIILSFIILLFGILLGTPYLLSVFNLDKKLVDYVADRLSKDDQSILNVNDIEIAFGRILLHKVEYRSEGARVDFQIEGLQFDYNLFVLITHLDEPQRAIDKVYLVDPTVVFKSSAPDSLPPPPEADTAKTNLLALLTQFDNIDRVHLKNGSILYKRIEGDSVVLAKNLNGWIDSRDFQSVSLSLDGDIFYGSSANLQMFCQVDLTDEHFFIQLDLQDYDLRHAPLAKFNKHLQIIDGNITSKLDIKSNGFNIDSVTVNGYIALSNTVMDVFGTKFKNVDMYARIANNRVVLNDGRAELKNSSFAITAVIENLLQPEITGEIRTDRLETSTLMEYFKLEGFQENYISVLGKFTLSPTILRASADLKAPLIVFNDQVVRDLEARIVLENDQLNWDYYTFRLFDINIEGNSRIDLSNGAFFTRWQTRRKFSDHYFFDKISGSVESAVIEIKGNYAQQITDGHWDYRLVNDADTLLCVNGTLQLVDDVFNFSNERTKDNDFLISLQIADIYNNPTINYGYIENLPFGRLTSRPWVSEMISKYSVDGILIGSFKDLNAQISIIDLADPERQFAVTANITNLLEDEKNASGNIRFNKFSGDYRVAVGDNYLKGSISSNHSLRGSIEILPERHEPLNASVQFDHFEINKMLTDTTLSGYGEINGQITIGGDIDNPKLVAELKGDRFIINDMGYYSFDLSMDADTSMIHIDTVKIALNNANILDGSLRLNQHNKEISAVFNGSEIDADYLMQTLFDRKGLLSGKAGYNFAFEGSMLAPKFSGSLTLENGIIEQIPFDKIQIQLEDSIAPGGQFLDLNNHYLQISDFVALKAGQYHLEGKGNLPLYEEGNIDLAFQFDGDLLWLIPKWDHFFIDGASFTTIHLGIAGTPRRPLITEGLLEMERGELWLKDVANHIENINAKIYLEKNTNFIVIDHVKGEIDKRKLLITNEKSVTTIDGKTLAPWFFKDINLNFGVLALETGKEGVELMIPALMTDGESGLIAVSGKGGGQKFYLAGPVGAPHAWGEVKISNSRITFPFPPGDGSEPSNAIKFLRNIDWDVHAVAGTDLQYVRNIPSFFGDVNTELNIDPSSEGLVFRGIIENETLRPEGRLISSRGRIEYLDLNFRVENFGFILNSGEAEPEVYGRAWTSVRDSLGASPKTIYLDLYAIDEATGAETRRARWEDFRFRLVSADPAVGESQEQVLAYLGYSVENVQDKAKQVGGAVTDNYLIRPLLRPLERGLERYLGFDFVRVNPRLTENLLSATDPSRTRFGLGSQNFSNSFMPYAFLIQSSEFTVGKYLTQDLYLSYTGQLVASANEKQNNFNLNHSVGLEYRFLKNLLFEFEYDRESLQLYNLYNEKSYQEDFKVRFRYSFSF